MIFTKYRLIIVMAFMSIFTLKMLISTAPVFVSCFDKGLANAVISQLEQEHCPEDDVIKSFMKFTDLKLVDFHFTYPCIAVLYFQVNNSFITYFKRYVDPYHPTVPTPPPDFVV